MSFVRVLDGTQPLKQKNTLATVALTSERFVRPVQLGFVGARLDRSTRNGNCCAENHLEVQCDWGLETVYLEVLRSVGGMTYCRVLFYRSSSIDRHIVAPS